MAFKRVTAAALTALALATGGAGTALADTGTASTSPYIAGFAYSQGWYMNHPTQWPCGINPNVAVNQYAIDMGLQTMPSQVTLLQLMQASSKSGVYYQLGQQVVAAYLNVMNGVQPDETVINALSQAMSWFSTATPTTPLTKDQTTQLKALIPILSNFNLGSNSVGTMPTCQTYVFQMARELKIRQ